MNRTTPPASNDLAIASLVLGILSLTGMGPLTGVPAIITGWMALKNPAGRSMAIAGLITGGISVLLTALVILLIFLAILLGLFAFSGADHPQHYDGLDSPSNSSESSFYQQQA